MQRFLNTLIDRGNSSPVSQIMNDIEYQREENIKRNQEQLKQLGIYLTPAASSRDATKRPPSKKRKLQHLLVPSRSSPRIAAAPARPSYVSEDEDEYTNQSRRGTSRPVPEKTKALTIKQEEVAVVPAQDIVNIRAGWTAWEATASCPARDQASTYHFEDQPSFTPNKSPEEMLREGCFGGSYFRPLFSRRLGTTIVDDYKELPSSWYSGLEPHNSLISSTYDAEINKYSVFRPKHRRVGSCRVDQSYI